MSSYLTVEDKRRARRVWLSEYRTWLRTSAEAPAVEYRRWVEIENQTRHKRSLARAAALRAYRRAHPTGPLPPAAVVAEAPVP
jgi:hypothetical protein